MATTYLFRIDSAKDNDAFFNTLRPSMSHVYAGVDIQVGSSGWSPDFIRISISESKDFALTLIELDATASAARISCRKYLPEDSTEIVQAFCKYLGRVIRECRSSAHPYEGEFARLKAMLEAGKVTVTTAGALRSSTNFIEELSLIDQPERIKQTQPVQTGTQEEARIFRGTLQLSADDAKAFKRSILVLDAVIRGDVHSGAAFPGWRKRQSPKIDELLKGNKATCPCFSSLLFDSHHGVTLDFEKLAAELAKVWSDAGKTHMDQEYIRELVSGYFPTAFEIVPTDRMPVIFDAAQKYLSAKII